MIGPCLERGVYKSARIAQSFIPWFLIMGAIANLFAAFLGWCFEVEYPQDAFPILPKPSPMPFLNSFLFSPGFAKCWQPLRTSTPISRDLGRPESNMVSRNLGGKSSPSPCRPCGLVETPVTRKTRSRRTRVVQGSGRAQITNSSSLAPVYGVQVPFVQYLQHWRVNEVQFSPYVPYKRKVFQTRAARLR